MNLFRRRERQIHPPFNRPRTSGAGEFGADWWWQQASFILPLEDLGGGAVNTTLALGVGPATFTRATTAWTKLSTGLWASVASGVARSSYIGLTTAVGAYGGYFAEGAGTQLVTPTASIRDMTNAAWVKGATMTAAMTGTGIDGVVNSCSRLTGGAVSATNTVLQTLVAAASSRTYSFWVRGINVTGSVWITQDGGSTWIDITAFTTSGWFTLVQLTASVLNASFGIKIDNNADVILVDFNQFEAGGSATSPMASAGAARNADILSFHSTSLSPTANTIYFRGQHFTSVDGPGTDQGLWGLNDAATNRANTDRYFGGGGNIAYRGQGLNADSGLNGGASFFKLATAFGTGDLAMSVNGSAVYTNAGGAALGAHSQINVGSIITSQQMYGVVSELRGWARRLPNTVLQAITT